MLLNHDPALANVLDTAAVTSVVAVLTGVLTPITLVLSFIWLAIRVYETKTVRHILGKRHLLWKPDDPSNRHS